MADRIYKMSFDIASYRGILLDTNLLLLLTAGLYSPKKIREFKRTQAFDSQDYEALIKLISRSKKLFTTPNILTEASNLLGNDLMPVLGTLICEFEECYVKSSQIIEENVKLFEKFGLSDAVIKQLSTENILIITVDLPLYHFISSLGLPVMNFTHIRGQYLL